jgi:hypothetical protein
MEVTGSGDDDSTMTVNAPVTLVEYRLPGANARQIRVTSEQLHARACVRCGREDGYLAPAGHVHTPTSPGQAPLGWAVVACAGCIQERSDRD